MNLLIAVSLLLLVPMLGTFRAEEAKPGKHSSLFQKYKDGPRGWTEADRQHSQGEWMNNTVVVVTAAEERKTFHVARAFIEKWGFADGGKSIVTRCRNAHGPSWIDKFEIASGKLLAECSGSEHLENTPEWARPWCDETTEKEMAKETAEKAAAEEKKAAPGQ